MKTLLRVGALALVCAVLSGCGALSIPNPLGAATGGPASITITGNVVADAPQFSPVLAKLKTFTAADVDNAIADAEAQVPPDAAGMGCWQTVKAAAPILDVPANAGVATGIQKSRDAQRWVPLIVQQCANIIPLAGP